MHRFGLSIKWTYVSVRGQKVVYFHGISDSPARRSPHPTDHSAPRTASQSRQTWLTNKRWVQLWNLASSVWKPLIFFPRQTRTSRRTTPLLIVKTWATMMLALLQLQFVVYNIADYPQDKMLADTGGHSLENTRLNGQDDRFWLQCCSWSRPSNQAAVVKLAGKKVHRKVMDTPSN